MAGVFDLSVGHMLAFSLVIVSGLRPTPASTAVVAASSPSSPAPRSGFVSGLVVVRLRVELVHRHARHQPDPAGGDAVHLGQPADHRGLPALVPRARPGASLGHPHRRATTWWCWHSSSGTCWSAPRSAGTCSPPAPTPSRAPVRGADRPPGHGIPGGLGRHLAGIAGVVYGAKIGSFSNSFGPPLLFPAFAAVFLGATQFIGRPNVWGTLLAVYTLAFGVKGLQLAFAERRLLDHPAVQRRRARRRRRPRQPATHDRQAATVARSHAGRR